MTHSAEPPATSAHTCTQLTPNPYVSCYPPRCPAHCRNIQLMGSSLVRPTTGRPNRCRFTLRLSLPRSLLSAASMWPLLAARRTQLLPTMMSHHPPWPVTAVKCTASVRPACKGSPDTKYTSHWPCTAVLQRTPKPTPITYNLAVRPSAHSLTRATQP
jgi:hypothetical protein